MGTMAITHDTNWQLEGSGWQPACPDCHRRATSQGSFGQCSDADWAVCYRDIGSVLSRIGPPPAPDREWPDWAKRMLG
jgi:hypothetical protein